MRIVLSIIIGLSLTSCMRAAQGGPYAPGQLLRPQYGQLDNRVQPLDMRANYRQATPTQNGVYQPQFHQLPILTERVPPEDYCRAELYQSLVGLHEGSIHFVGLPGRKRILKPAFDEGFESDFLPEMEPEQPFIEVRDFLPGQRLYTPSIITAQLAVLEPEVQDRLTIRLDLDGFVEEVVCG